MLRIGRGRHVPAVLLACLGVLVGCGPAAVSATGAAHAGQSTSVSPGGASAGSTSPAPAPDSASTPDLPQPSEDAATFTAADGTVIQLSATMCASFPISQARAIWPGVHVVTLGAAPDMCEYGDARGLDVVGISIPRESAFSCASYRAEQDGSTLKRWQDLDSPGRGGCGDWVHAVGNGGVTLDRSDVAWQANSGQWFSATIGGGGDRFDAALELARHVAPALESWSPTGGGD